MDFYDDDDGGNFGFGNDEFDDIHDEYSDGDNFGDYEQDQSDNLDFQAGFKDFERGGNIEGSFEKSKTDPRERVKYQFKEFYTEMKGKIGLTPSLKILDKMDNLENLNPELLAIAAVFNTKYSSKGGLNEKNFKNFTKKSFGEKIHMVDIIRYIRHYELYS